MVNVFTNYSTSVLMTVGDVLNWLSFLFFIGSALLQKLQKSVWFPFSGSTNQLYLYSFLCILPFSCKDPWIYIYMCCSSSRPLYTWVLTVLTLVMCIVPCQFSQLHWSNSIHLYCQFTAFLFKVNPQNTCVHNLSSAIQWNAVSQWQWRNDTGGLTSTYSTKKPF